MIRTYKFLLRPAASQRQAMSAMLADHCSLYNAAPQERRDAWRHPTKSRVKYGDQSRQLKDIRSFDPEGQGRWSFSSQATLRRLDKAFAGFFRRVKTGKSPGSPRFRAENRFYTVDFPKDGDGCRRNSTPGERAVRVYLRGVGHVRVHQHREVAGAIKTVGVKRERNRWYVLLAAEKTVLEPLPTTGTQVGIDLGSLLSSPHLMGGTFPTPVTHGPPPRNSGPHSRT